jgi:hypothetical protein
MKANVYLLILVVFITAKPGFAQENSLITTEPGQASIIYSDLVNFSHFLNRVESGDEISIALKEEYLDKASPGLLKHIEDQQFTHEDFIKAVDSRLSDYQELRDLPGTLQSKEPDLRQAYVRLSEVLPGSVFMPVYYFVGVYKGMFAEPSEIGISVSITSKTTALEHITELVIHENVHVQQVMAVGLDEYMKVYGPKKNLLSLAIREGTAEFFTMLVTGKITQQNALSYLLENEESLWRQFAKNMDDQDPGDWMWQKPSNQDWPNHIGYAMGYRIIDNYYQSAEDKAMAKGAILASTDARTLLDASGYGEGFTQSERAN